ncbi:MAG: FecR domain-containing protein [Bacteroidota bacterium]|nr:FecR domain-containing protein [Bacteroidota bacterium]
MNNENLNRKNICGESEKLIDDYLDGMISLKDKVLIDKHISNCPNCTSYISENTELIKNLNRLTDKGVNLSFQKKNDFWNKIDSGINFEKHQNEMPVNTVDNKNSGFISKYKYFISGIAAIFLITLIIFAVKNLSLKDIQLSQQSTFGLPTYWKVANVQGSPLIGDVSMQGVDSIKEGQSITTNDSSRAELIIADLGKVLIEPNSKVIFLKSSEGNNRIMVEYGTIDADMNSKQKTFFVEMPSAVASDLNGEYTLTIDSTGDGVVYVKSGKVQIQSGNNREAIVPAGNLVITRKDLGVGTPFNENSSAKFKNALFNLDFGKCGGACVSTLLNSAKMSDAVTLVNLIDKVDNEYKDEVYTRVAKFVAPPRHVETDSIPFLDEEELNEWIDKIQVEIEENVERSIKEVEKNLEQIKQFENFNPDTLEALQDFAKNWKFKIENTPDGNYEWSEDSAYFDKEQFKKDMEEMHKDIKENIHFDKEEFKDAMEELKKELKEMKEDLNNDLNLNSEELKKEMEKVKEEIKKSVKEIEKIEIQGLPDSIKKIYKVKEKKAPEDPEEMQVPEAPEIPDLEKPSDK